MKAAIGVVLVAAGLCVAVMIRADEAPLPRASGPVVAPLGRPADRTVRLEYPASVAAIGEGSSPTSAAKPQRADLFSKFGDAASSTNEPIPAETDRPLRLPAVYAAKPNLPAAIEAEKPGETPPSAEKDSTWRPVQAAFRQLTAPIPNGPSTGAPPSGSMPDGADPAPAAPIAPSDAPSATDLPSVRIDALPPWKTVPARIEPNMHPSEIIMGDGEMPPPGYFGGSRIPKSECAYCTPAPAFGCCTCQSVRQGGPGCNSGDCSADGTCANCGGACGGGCSDGCQGGCGHKGGNCNGCEGGRYSNWVNGNGLPIAGTPAYGSCVLQRLACCLCAPYPDCSNGCVDFCHSWIFHEDCCWLTTNHKCCNPGCPEHPYGGCSNGTGGCGCGCAECVPPPDWYFTADAMILTRDNQAADQGVVTETGSGATLLSTGNFDFVYEVGPSFTVGYRPTPWDAWEFSYFGLMDWNTQQSLVGAGDLNLPGALGAALDLNFANADAMNASYSSVIHNAEANYFWTYGQIMWMVGFRYFHLGEDFDITSTGPLGSTAYDTITRNNLYGGQIGARYRAGWERFNWDIFGKAGAFGNEAEQRQFVSNVGDIPIRDTSTRDGNWAFVGDVGVNLTYRLGKCWSVRGGYNAVWVEGAALAPNQLDFTDTPVSGATLHHNGGVFLHGAHAGFGCRW